MAHAVRVVTIDGATVGVRAPVHVVTLSGSSYSIAIGLANHAIDGGLERPSTLCRSTPGCVAAVNGDFFDLTSRPDSDPGDEVGGIIQNCVLLHTPEIPISRSISPRTRSARVSTGAATSWSTA